MLRMRVKHLANKLTRMNFDQGSVLKRLYYSSESCESFKNLPRQRTHVKAVTLHYLLAVTTTMTEHADKILRQGLKKRE